MSLLVLLLILLVICIWTAPRFVKPLGKIAVVASLLNAAIGLMNAAGVVVAVGDIPTTLVWGGVRSMLISIIFALVLYLMSIVSHALVENK